MHISFELPPAQTQIGTVHYARVAKLLHWFIAALVSFEFISAASFRLFSELGYPQRVHINDTLMPFHSIISYASLCVVALHVSAALYQYFWLRDHVLVRMLPIKGIRQASKQDGPK
jgi:cytochrome b561